MSKPRSLLSLAVSVLIGLTANGARAWQIEMTIDIPGQPTPTIPVDAFASTQTLNSYDVDATALVALNAALAIHGSAYQFTDLGGSSTFPGQSGGALGAQLEVHGTIQLIPGSTGSTVLTLTEREAPFTEPVGSAGTLMSMSNGSFTNQLPGGGHTASSSFNATPTLTYSVFATSVGPNNMVSGNQSVGISPVNAPFMLTNVITVGLTAADSTMPVTDKFDPTVTLTVVPEPSSLVMLLTGISVPLVASGWLRRHPVEPGVGLRGVRSGASRGQIRMAVPEALTRFP